MTHLSRASHDFFSKKKVFKSCFLIFFEKNLRYDALLWPTEVETKRQVQRPVALLESHVPEPLIGAASTGTESAETTTLVRAAFTTPLELPADHFSKIERMRCYFPLLTKEQSELLLDEDLVYIVHGATKPEVLDDCVQYSISFFKKAPEAKVVRVRVFCRAGVGLCFTQSFAPAETFPTLASYLTATLAAHGLTFGS